MKRAVILLAACGRVGFEAQPDARIASTRVEVVYSFDQPPANGRVACSVPALDAFCTDPFCPTAVAGHTSGGYHFNGAEGLYLPSSTLVGADPFTVAVWFEQDGSGVGTLVAKPTDGVADTDSFAAFIGASGTLSFETTSASNIPQYFNATIVTADTAWHHMAMTWDGVSHQAIYVDGVPAGTGENDHFVDTLEATYVGIDLDNDALHVGFTGVLDELRFFPRALSAGEIDALVHVP